MDSQQKSTRKVWTREETLLFLTCYAARKQEFKKVRGKKSAYKHVLQDMVAQGFEDTSVTEDSLKCKMKTLMTAYNSAIYHNKRTGVPYQEQMEEIFGDMALVANVHRLNSFSNSASSSLSLISTPSSSRPLSTSPKLPISSPSPSFPECPSPVNPRKRKSTRDLYYKAKIEAAYTVAEETMRKLDEFMATYKEIELRKISILEYIATNKNK